MKKGIRYLRISKEKQSNFSIEAQDMYTKGWFDRNDVEISGTFIDDGYTAQNFDRPDFQKLEQFIKQYHRTVDYLVVNSFDRFSRDAGEALSKIKQLQNKFSINVVSVVEGVTFDRNDPGSFFYTGLLLLKGEDELIRHKYRVNMGIYTAKKKFGRYLGAAPWGYINFKDGEGRPQIKPDPEKAEVIRFIYKHFLLGVPQYIILDDVKAMTGNFIKSNSAIKRILTNGIYTGYLNVKPVRDLPGGVVDGAWDPIIDRPTWHMVQEKMKGGNPKLIVDDQLPLRGILKCHCGKTMTGAPSRGKSGKLFNYYKCVKPHNNLSANKAHQQLAEVLSHLSLPHNMVAAITRWAESTMEARLMENRKMIEAKKRDLQNLEKQINSLEEKYIADKIQHDTYYRWHTEFTQKKVDIRYQVDQLSADQNEAFLLMRAELPKLTDMKYVWEKAGTLHKQSLVKTVFDSQLYYREGVYRTPYIMPIFHRNTLILKEKNLLIYEGKLQNQQALPSSGAGGIVIEHLTRFLELIRKIA
jgi:DNA invertase Pin-like site-specific DNA recombinase